MIKIITVGGFLVIKESFIHSIFKKNGRYFITILHENHFEKWEIPAGSYIDLMNRLYGEKEA